MKSNKQSGRTILSAFVVAFVVGCFFTVVFKLGPHYLDNRMIQAAFNQVGESDIGDKSDSEIRRKIADFFTINNIRDIDITTVAIDRETSGTSIRLDYERRFAMFGNVDVVLRFSNQHQSTE